MPHHQVTDFGPGPLAPALRAEVIAAARERVRRLAPDRDGNVHVSDVLEALAALEEEG